MNLEDYINKAKSETACFAKADCERVAEFIVGIMCIPDPCFGCTIISGNGF
jgi:hypothetical protein